MVPNLWTAVGNILFFYQFDDFQNQFVDPIQMVTGARTISLADGKLLAEAKVDYYIKDGNRQGRRLEEFHYDAYGKLIFYCKSVIDPDTGFKINEIDKIGKKEREYYSIWPV